MALSLIKKVLGYVHEMKRFPLDEILLHEYSGFRRLQGDGYIDIVIEDEISYAILTMKGIKLLENSLDVMNLDTKLKQMN
jgi:hypothetical protein